MNTFRITSTRIAALVALFIFAAIYSEGVNAQDVTYSNILRLTAASGPYSDETVTRFASEATYGFDGDWDAYKLMNGGNTPDIFTSMNGNTYSINSFPGDFTEYEVKVNLIVKFSGAYSITASGLDESFDPSYTVVLEDRLLHVSQDLWTAPEYDFDAVIGDTTSRFFLHFSRSVINIPVTTDTVAVNVPDSTSVTADTTVIASSGNTGGNETQVADTTTAPATDPVTLPSGDLVSGNDDNSSVPTGTDVSEGNNAEQPVVVSDSADTSVQNNDKSINAPENEKMNFNIYPVPSDGRMNIGGFTKTNHEKTVRILGSTGKVLFEKSLASDDIHSVLQVDLSDNKGILTVQEISGKDVVVKRIVVM